MKNILALIIILTVSFGTSFSQTDNQYVKDCIPSVVTLILEDDFKQTKLAGSGFVVGKGKILTSLNLMEGTKFGYVLEANNPTKHKIEGYFVLDKENHLVVLSVPTIKAEPLKISYRDNLDIGTRIYALSHKRGVTAGINRGIITGTREFGDRKIYQISSPISPGSNGGAVVDKNGEVIGLALSALYSGQDVNVAVPSVYIRELLKDEVETAQFLNIPEGTAVRYTNNEQVKHILKGINIVNKEYEDNIESPNVKVGDKVLTRFSIQNDFPHSISNLKLSFIAIGNNGLPIDEYQKIFFEGGADKALEPFKTKSVDLTLFDWEKARALRLKAGESLEIRVIDFEFLE